MRGFRFRKSGEPVATVPVAPELGNFTGRLPCRFCGEAILHDSETWYSLSRYDGNRFRATREAHARCIAALADQDVGEDPPKEV